jgi:predicted peptidase
MTGARPLFTALACSLVVTAGCARPTTGFLTRTVTLADGQAARYAVFVPHGYRPDDPVPVILFLHGAGEGGADGEAPTRVGLGPAVRQRAATFPFLVVFPQSPDRPPNTFWTWAPGQPGGDRALAALEAAQREYLTDPRRVYLTGASVGGTGVWHLAAAHPERWAAIVPVCGVGPVDRAEAVGCVPCWCFHGAEDRSVPVAHSRDMIGALRRAGGSPRYTEYAAVGHNSWENAYGTDELYTWLRQQARQ